MTVKKTWGIVKIVFFTLFILVLIPQIFLYNFGTESMVLHQTGAGAEVTELLRGFERNVQNKDGLLSSVQIERYETEGTLGDGSPVMLIELGKWFPIKVLNIRITPLYFMAAGLGIIILASLLIYFGKLVMGTQKTESHKKKKDIYREKYKLGDAIWAYVLITPSIAGLLILDIIPFIRTVIDSFIHVKKHEFTFQYYVNFFTDANFERTNFNTLFFMVMTVPVGIILALVTAAMLNREIKGRDTYRAIFFLPMVCAPAAVAIVWRVVVLNSEVGFLNPALAAIGITGPDWIADPGWIPISVAVVGIWGGIGFDVVLLLAGLQSISRTYYEAARIDGATAVAQFRHITIPMISPALFFVLVMKVMNALKQFDTLYMISPPTGNPWISNIQTLMYRFYYDTYGKTGDKIVGMPFVIWLVVITLAITFYQFQMEKKWVNYDA